MQVRTFYKVIAFWFLLMTNSKRNMIFSVRRFTNKRADNLLATWTQFQNGLFYAMYWQTWTFSHVLDRKKMVHSYNTHTHTHAQNHQLPYSSGMSGKARRDEVGWLVGRSVVERDWVFFRLVSIALNMQITFWWGIPRSNLFTFTILASKLLNIFMLVIYIDNEIPSHNFSYSSLALLTVAADSRMSVSKRKTPIK